MVKMAWVELSESGLAIRIFRNMKMAAVHAPNPNRGLVPEPIMGQMGYAEAIGQIRRQVFKRDDYCCVKCGAAVVWERGQINSGEMDERQARGKCVADGNGHYRSGEISVENCQTLCKKCHTGVGGKHDRSPSWTKDATPSAN